MITTITTTISSSIERKSIESIRSCKIDSMKFFSEFFNFNFLLYLYLWFNCSQIRNICTHTHIVEGVFSVKIYPNVEVDIKIVNRKPETKKKQKKAINEAKSMPGRRWVRDRQAMQLDFLPLPRV